MRLHPRKPRDKRGRYVRRTAFGRKWDELIAAGVLHPPAEAGDPFENWPEIRLRPGTAAELIDIDRGEASSQALGC